MQKRPICLLKRRGERGYLLLLSMFITSGLLTLSGIGMARSVIELNAAQHLIETEQAFQQAEAEVDAALGALVGRTSADISQAVLQQGPDGVASTADDGTLQLLDTPYAAGPVMIRVLDNDDGDGNPLSDADGVLTIRTPGTAVNGTRRRLLVTFVQNPDRFQDALFGGRFVRVGSANHNGAGQVLVDSYNSQLGAYNELIAGPTNNRGSEGHVGTNDSDYLTGTDVGDIDLRLEWTANIQGNLKLGNHPTGAPPGTARPSFATNTVNGISARCNGHNCSGADTSVVDPVMLPSIDFPSCPGTPIDKVLGPNEELTLSGFNCFRTLTVHSEARLNLAPEAQLYLTGASAGYKAGEVPGYFRALSVAGNGQIRAYGQNEIYVNTGRVMIMSNNGLVSHNDLDGNPATKPSPRDLIVRAKGNTSKYNYAPNGAGENDDYWSGWGGSAAPNLLEQGRPFYGAMYLETGFLFVKGMVCNNLADCGMGDETPAYGTDYAYTNIEHYGSIVAGHDLNIATHSSPWQNFHRDVSLADFTLSGRAPFQILAWRELAPDEP